MVPLGTAHLLSQCLAQTGTLATFEFDKTGALRQSLGVHDLLPIAQEGLPKLLQTLSLPSDWMGRAQRQVGTKTYWISLCRDQQAALVLMQDVTELVSRETELRHQAETDHLTGLLNRRGFERSIASLFAAPDQPDRFHVIGIADVDNLKSVNETLGYEAGDVLLKAVACQIESTLRSDDCTGRIGGDEFGFCIAHVPQDRIDEILDRLLDGIRQNTDGSVSIGAVRGSCGQNPKLLQVRAGELVLNAKRAGKNQIFHL